MKTKYFKGITAISFVAVLFLSSCLKDKRYFDPESVTSNVAELPLSGLANFSKDAVTKAGLDTITFAVGVTAATPPSTPTTITIGVDNSVITTYNAANPAIVYQPIPTASYKLPITSVTIPAGQNSTLTTVIIDRTLLDPAVSYMLPVKVVNAGGITISANFGIHYYHIIGNDFAGTYNYDYTRTPASGNFVGHTAILSPVSPTQFETFSSYYTAKERYEVTFTRTVVSGVPMYSNFNVIINADDVTNIFTAGGISITTPPKIIAPGYDPTKSYIYADAVKLFDFQYQVLGGSGARTVEDRFYK